MWNTSRKSLTGPTCFEMSKQPTVINGIKSISPEAGKYIVLADYGQGSGICVVNQSDTIQESLEFLASGYTADPLSLVKLVEIMPDEVI